MPVADTLAVRLSRRLRRELRAFFLRLAHRCDPTADLSSLAHIEAAVFTPRVLGQPLAGLRLLYVGSCQISALAMPDPPLGGRIEHLLYDASWVAEIPLVDLAAYDAVAVGLSLRTLINESYRAQFDLAHARDDWTPEAAQVAFDHCVGLIDARLTMLSERFAGRPTFVFTFLEPSFDYLGQLQPSADIDYPSSFVRRLNQTLARMVSHHPGMYVFDLNQAFNAVGRLHLQDDVVTNFTHASTIGTIDDSLNGERLVATASNHEIYDVQTVLPILQSYVFRSLSDAVKIVRGVDRVKLIIVDLDDTLWRGVAAESEVEAWARVEGWPLGFAEALLYFKKRGGLLAICSKNDHDATVQRFAAIWGDRLLINDFVSVQINWSSKAQNVAAILEAVNILPEQALFIDDNPREIAEVQASFPTLRCLGGVVGANPRDWRRIILRSPETQVETVSDESQRRTELVRAKIVRDTAPRPVDRTAWLVSLELHETLFLIQDTRSSRFTRVFELINKTNQFNTTGQRWSLGEFEAFFAAGGKAVAAALRDRTIDNGLIGVALVRPGEIVQVVLSCRVFGLGAETVLGIAAMTLALAEGGQVVSRPAETGKNLSCRTYFDDLGFTRRADDHVADAPPSGPDWIRVELDRSLKAALNPPQPPHPTPA